MKTINYVLSVAGKEIRLIAADRGTLAILILLPILLGSLFAGLNLMAASGGDGRLHLDGDGSGQHGSDPYRPPPGRLLRQRQRRHKVGLHHLFDLLRKLHKLFQQMTRIVIRNVPSSAQIDRHHSKHRHLRRKRLSAR